VAERQPDALAWRCASCGAEFAGDGADQGQGSVYECGGCGARYNREGSADGASNRCPDCGHFGAKLAELACPECGEGELEPIGGPPVNLQVFYRQPTPQVVDQLAHVTDKIANHREIGLID